jgi:hypothetical protein
LSLSTRTWRYEHAGLKALKPKPNGGRKHENMTLAEKSLARAFCQSGQRQWLNIMILKTAYEKVIGHARAATAGLHLLHRHGWFVARRLNALDA